MNDKLTRLSVDWFVT